METVLKVQNLSKSYRLNEKSLQILQDIDFELVRGESVSIVGSSGSGKTTLLGLCAGLDVFDEGSIKLNGTELKGLSEDEKAALRNRHVGFVFQNFQLMPTLTALENVMIPLELRGDKNARKSSMDWLDRVGLGERKNHYPSQMSGGEQQRVSIARAFSNNPLILFADEPTGNLDDETSASIESMLFDINKENNTTLVLVTHDLELAAKTGRLLRIKGGRIIEDAKSILK